MNPRKITLAIDMAEIKEYQQMYTVRGNLKLRRFIHTCIFGKRRL
jgi:hypothetical protein